MTFAASCGWSLVRSLLIAAAGLFLARRLQRFLDHQVQPCRRLAWCLLLIPFFSPSLIVGYGYRNYALSLVQHPLLNELLYGLILVFQVVPVGVALLHFAPPPPISAEALHCYRLGPNERHALFRSWLVYGRLTLGGPLQSQIAAASLMFLVSFQEAEVAALMQASGWTEWLFTRQAGLYDVQATLGYVAVVVAIEAAFLVPVLLWVRQRFRVRGTARQYGPQSVSHGWWLMLVCGVLVNALIPGWFVLSGAVDGVGVLRQQPAFWRELLHGLVYAASAVTMATCVSALLGRFATEEPGIRVRTILSWCVLIPGLCGSLTLGLLLSGLFQRQGLQWAYDSPVGLIAGLTLYLLPRVAIVRACLWTTDDNSMIHTARLLRQSPCLSKQRAANELVWRSIGRPRFWGFVLVFFWAYLELTVADILAPPGLEPVVKRLYNLMHFGHISGLAAMVCVTLAAPLVLVLAALLGRRTFPGRLSA